MLKSFSEFNDLRDGVNIYRSIEMSHFKDGLDPSQIISRTICLVSQIKDKEHLMQVSIFYPFLYNALSQSISNQNNSFSYFKNKIAELKKFHLIKQEHLNDLAFLIASRDLDYECLLSMIENNVVDVNITRKDGKNLLFFTNNAFLVKKLIKLGCDVHKKINNEFSQYNSLTPYEAAIKTKKKSWINALQQGIPFDLIKKEHIKNQDELKNTNDVQTQLKLFKKSLSEKDYEFINLIKKDQTKYHKLISNTDNKGKDLIHYAIEAHNHYLLEELLSLEYYKNNKDKLNNQGYCYTTYAAKLNKTVALKYLFNKGFKNDLIVEDYINDFNKSKAKNLLFNSLLLKGYVPKLTASYVNNHKQHLDEHIKNATKEELILFFNKCSFLLNFKEVDHVTNQYTNLYVDNKKYLLERDVFKMVVNILKKQEEVDEVNFHNNLATLVSSLSNGYEEISKKLIKQLLEILPHKKHYCIDCLENKDWVINIKKKMLEESLEMKQENSKRIKI